MSTSSSRPRRLWQIRARLRVPLGIGSLLILVYLMVGWSLLKPPNTVEAYWETDGIARLYGSIPPEFIVSLSTGTVPQPGDELLAIDGIPYQLSDLQFHYGPPADYHTYEFQRGTQRYTAVIASGQLSSYGLLNVIVCGLIFLAMWILGFLIILFAPVDDEAAWLVGLVWIGFSIGGASYMPLPDPAVPGVRLIFEVVVPFLLVGYLETAFLPDRTNVKHKAVFRFLYGLAAVLSSLALIEVFLLNPQLNWGMLFNFSPSEEFPSILYPFYYNVGLLVMCSVPMILAFKSWRLPPGPARRQVRILLMSAVPIMIPLLVTEEPLYLLTLPLVLTLPAGYGYVIYRHRYLHLDVFASRSLIAVFAAGFVSMLYLLGVSGARRAPTLAPLESVIGLGILLLGFALMGRVSDRLKQGVDLLLYGSQHDLERTLAEVTTQLSANPQFNTLKSHLLIQVATALHVKHAALLIRRDDLLIPLGMLQVESVAPLTPTLLTGVPEVLLRQVKPEEPLFQIYPWTWLIAPIRSRAKVEGVLLLGRKIPDDFYHAKEVAFLRQVTAATTIAIENTRLFEALREMSQDLLRVRMLERWQISARLHDEPLQRAGAIVYQLDRLLSSYPQCEEPELTLGIRRQKEEVRCLAQELRDICSGLRPPILDQGLRLTLREVAQTFRQKLPETKLSLVIDDRSLPLLSNEEMDAVYHVVTEALNNVVKHASATQVEIKLTCLAETICISITDNGRGVPPTELLLPELLRNHHFGIAGMYQWMELVGGELRMESIHPQGMGVYLSLPLKSQTESC